MSEVPIKWSFHDDHVDDQVRPGNFLSAESVFLAAGPPEILVGESPVSPQQLIDDDGGYRSASSVYPIGVVDTVSISQTKQLQRIFEIGSSISFEIPGRVVGGMNMSRVQYHGISLLRALYAPYYSTGGPHDIAPLTSRGTVQYVNGPTVNPGYDNFWMNLQSELFNQPFGVMLYMLDQLENPVASLYAEICHPVSVQSSISSGSVLLMEGVSFEFSKLVPVRVTDDTTNPNSFTVYQRQSI